MIQNQIFLNTKHVQQKIYQKLPIQYHQKVYVLKQQSLNRQKFNH
jgi:hypothetical protein